LDLRGALQFPMAYPGLLVLGGVEKLSWDGETRRTARTVCNAVASVPVHEDAAINPRLFFPPDAELTAVARGAAFHPGDVPGLPETPPDFAGRAILTGTPPRHDAFGSRSARHILGNVRAGTRFVVQLHDATTLHFDFRLQSGEVLRSWAVPKGPSLDPAVRRLAVPVDDHSLSAGEFEGIHEGQRRGTGAVIIWDEGTADIIHDDPGHVSFILHGGKLAGGFALTRTGPKRWILVKVRDEDARPGSDIVAEEPASVRSGRTWTQLREQ
jgi:DNA ligase D-like protein (predicted 3'-phosphoesterase)